MVVGIPKVFALEGVCKGYLIRKNLREPFEYGNVWVRIEPIGIAL
jgi:hypothetical protein